MNCRLRVLEATALPTEPQPLPPISAILFLKKIDQTQKIDVPSSFSAVDSRVIEIDLSSKGPHGKTHYDQSTSMPPKSTAENNSLGRFVGWKRIQ